MIESLNPQQQKIVQHNKGPALVIAGAGSGKTRVITHRVAHLIQSGVKPSSIMLLTFTNKAAAEMSNRVAQAVGESQVKHNIIHGTFHSVGNRFLRRYASLLKFENNFTILDSSDSRDLIKASMAEVLGKANKNFPKAALLQNIFSLAFNKYCNQQEMHNTKYPNRHFELKSIIQYKYPYFEEHLETILSIQKTYRKKKRRNNSMDFDDLLEHWLDLLLLQGDRLPLKQQIQYVLVDEYQDTNQVQANILDCLSETHRNLMVVGDDAQSIYSWRGANFRNILTFPDRYQAVTYRMEKNYRSSPEILNTANASISQNTEQFKKTLFSELAPGEKPIIYHLWDPEAEAEILLDHIYQFRDQEISLNDMSVLYRNHVQSATLQVALTKASIPFVVHSGVKFFEQAHMKDLTSMLKVLFNPLDEVSWMRLLKLLPGVGNSTAYKIFNVFHEQNAVRLTSDNEKLQKLIPKNAREDWNKLLECFKAMLQDGTKPSQMISILYDRFYKTYLLRTFDNAPQREADIDYLKEFAENYQTLEHFLNELSLVGSSVIKDYEAEQNQEEEVLTLTTIHQAKGLEWSVVFLIGLTENLFPHQRCMENDEQLEEERRLFYVALTRAKRHLILTAPVMSSGFQRSERYSRSRFIKELPEELIAIEVHESGSYDYYPSSSPSRFIV